MNRVSYDQPAQVCRVTGTFHVHIQYKSYFLKLQIIQIKSLSLVTQKYSYIQLLQHVSISDAEQT